MNEVCDPLGRDFVACLPVCLGLVQSILDRDLALQQVGKGLVVSVGLPVPDTHGTLLAEGAGNDFLVGGESVDVGDIDGLTTRATVAAS